MSWDQIRGHDLAQRQLEAAWQRHRLAHAYLFAGPGGVGKALFAREFAKALHCQNKTDSLAACGSCPSCKYSDAGRHPDTYFAGRPEEKLELPIEVIRELCSHLALKPTHGTHRIAILDDADDLNESSANAFLKTLEEPPPGSVLILIGSDPERQLATIVSRCQVIRFAPLRPDDLEAILQSQGIDDAEQRKRLSSLAGGSAGQALALNDPGLWAFRLTLLKGLAAAKPNSVELAQRWQQFCEEAGKDSAAHRRRASQVLRLLVGMLQAALRSTLGQEIDAEADERRLVQTLGERLGPEQLMEWLERCFEADAQIDRRVQLVLILEALTDSLVGKMSAA